MTLQDIADRLHCRLEGDGRIEIRRVTGIHQARTGDLTFVANPRYASHVATTKASAIILGLQDAAPAHLAVLRCDDPYTAFARALQFFVRTTPPAKGVDRLSAVAPDATIGPGVSIGPFVTIGSGASIGARTVIYPNVVIGPEARIGEDCVIHSQTSIREGVVIGHRVVLHDGVVVGSDGYGFARQKDGTHLKIPQHADVVIEDDVEIGANSTIDRPAVGETRIGAGTKLDNLVHVAHGVTIGRRVLLAAQVGIAGSTAIEDDVMMAGQTGVTGHITVGKRAMVGAKSAVLNSVEAGAFVTGHPAIEHAEWRKSSVIFRHLPELKKRLEELERRLATQSTALHPRKRATRKSKATSRSNAKASKRSKRSATR
ncbi:MAG: UDP-3-O-(3-hydroxymyristoyl)glucosamine N-acyltransferase [Acidobacteriia bacterium]|nr:UDP-3-O-(3-hydroxymyristoyl)glucosamine N-acyltransferase [Terriglobia bacterium]